jgi:hypothetical protein
MLGLFSDSSGGFGCFGRAMNWKESFRGDGGGCGRGCVVIGIEKGSAIGA